MIKIFLSYILWTFIFLAVFLPAISGFIDILCNFYLGHSITGITWQADDGWRVVVAVIWPVFVAMLAAAFMV